MLRPKQSLFARLLSRVTSACVVLLLMMAGGGASVFAQTPAATIENSNGDTRLQVNYDGGLLAPGLHDVGTPADSIPATGPGARMMWYPGKAAFRAGVVTAQAGIGTSGDAWDAANIGPHSVAFGHSSTASAYNAMSVGFQTKASGDNSFAMGSHSISLSRHSVSMGNTSEASGVSAFAMGTYASAYKDHAVAMGDSTVANGKASTALGNSTEANGTYATALGNASTANGKSSTALGTKTNADGESAVAMGLRTSAPGVVSTAMGTETVASAAGATAMGLRTEAVMDYSLSIGEYNSANTSQDNTLFVAGNGTENNRSDALVLDVLGNLSIEGTFTNELGTFAGHFTASKNADETNNPDAHVAFIENTNTGADADALAIQTGPADGPDAGNNFVTFFDGDGTAIGRIEGNANTGVTYETSGADYAEELPVAETASSVPEATDLVGVRGGTVSFDTEGADRVMIASSHPAVTGNATSTTDAPRIDVAFVGQVPVQLRGTAEIGDLIVASGQNDGTARAVASDQYRRSEHGPVAGQAWSEKTTSGLDTVTVAVGLGTGDVLAEQLEEERARNDRQEQRIAALEERLTALEDHHSSVLAGLPGSWLLGGAFVLLLLGGGIGTVLRREDR